MGGKPSKAEVAEKCFVGVCRERTSCLGWEDHEAYNSIWVRHYNLDLPEVKTRGVFRPANPDDAALGIQCAANAGFPVQALSGGHSYGNLAVSTPESIIIDLHHVKRVMYDSETELLTVEAGAELGDIDAVLAKHKRAIAHGTCPSVGIGGHATVGGLGPMSRMWGTAADNIVSMEVALVDGTLVRANETINPDLFWAMRGAGSSFGIATEFVFKTYEEPARVIEYTYSYSLDRLADLVPVYRDWQALASDPKLDRRFSTQFMALPDGATITGTFYGTEAEFKATGIGERMPKGGDTRLERMGWTDSLKHQANVSGQWLAGVPVPFDTRSFALTEKTLLSEEGARELFHLLGQFDDTIMWYLVFDSMGGAMADKPRNATAFPHRDMAIIMHSYATGLPKVKKEMHKLMVDMDAIVRRQTGARHTYAGYVLPGRDQAQTGEMYYAENLPKLRDLKKKYDPYNFFRNPQSVPPPKGGEEVKEGKCKKGKKGKKGKKQSVVWEEGRLLNVTRYMDWGHRGHPVLEEKP